MGLGAKRLEQRTVGTKAGAGGTSVAAVLFEFGNDIRARVVLRAVLGAIDLADVRMIRDQSGHDRAPLVIKAPGTAWNADPGSGRLDAAILDQDRGILEHWSTLTVNQPHAADGHRIGGRGAW